MRKIVFDVFVFLIIVATVFFAYRAYGDKIVAFVFDRAESTLYLESTPISVTIADDPEERKQGLSGVESLGEFEGKLFVFPEDGHYGIWMKDMRFSLDILWIDSTFRIVHIEKNVSPATYPETFVSDMPARFVLEVNAFVTENANITVGDTVSFPPRAIPWDLISILR